MSWKHIAAAGVELEGGWHATEHALSRRSGTDVHHDGSVELDGAECSCGCDCECGCGEEDCESCCTECLHNNGRCDYCIEGRTAPAEFIGELVSSPCGTWEELKAFLEENQPALFNDTCGLHVHLSVKNEAHYAVLAQAHFVECAQRWVRAWAHYYQDELSYEQRIRLLEGQKFCQKMVKNPRHVGWNDGRKAVAMLKGEIAQTIAAQLRVRQYEDSRYHMVNFCKGKHGTVEFRAFPMMEKALAQAGVRDWLKFVDAYLEKHGNELEPLRRRQRWTAPDRLTVALDEEVTLEAVCVSL